MKVAMVAKDGAGDRAGDRAKTVADVLARRQVARDRDAAERARIDRILGRAAPPAACGPEIPVAPARGPMVAFAQIVLRVKPGVDVPTGDADYERWHDGYLCRSSAREADVFDRMENQSRRRRKAGDGAAEPLFTLGQKTIGRYYRNLWERHQAGGMKCSSLEALRASGGSGGDFMDAFLSEGLTIERLQARIGQGQAMAIRRVRPSVRGSRSGIMDRALVDAVCLQDMDLSAVLKRHGWSVKGDTVLAAHRALVAALDRMMGYKGA